MATEGKEEPDSAELLGLLNDPTSDERELALVILGARAGELPAVVREEVLDVALELTRHPRRRVRMQAMLCLGFEGLIPEGRRVAVVDRLLELLGDPHPDVRAVAEGLLRVQPGLVPEERMAAVADTLARIGRGRGHPGHRTRPLGVEDPFTGEVQMREIDVDIADAVGAANEALKRAGLALRTVGSCQGYTRDVDPPVHAGFIAFDAGLEPAEFHREGRDANPLLLEAAWRALQRSAEDGQVSVRAGFQRVRSLTEQGEETFHHLALSICLYGRDLADPMRAVWAAFAEELKVLQGLEGVSEVSGRPEGGPPGGA